jgi:hypothetical protein
LIDILSATSDARGSRAAFVTSEAELCERLDEQTTHDRIEDVPKLKASSATSRNEDGRSQERQCEEVLWVRSGKCQLSRARTDWKRRA